jgi:replicative DNA helicase
MTKNSPPLRESELKKTFESVCKLESKSKNTQPAATIFLENPANIVSDYKENFTRIPFAGNNLQLTENFMNGGLLGGRIYFLGGIPSTGKTALANNLADNTCLNDRPVLFFSHDDGKSELVYRTLARFSTHTIEDFNGKRVPDDKLKALCEQQQVKKILERKYVVEKITPLDQWPPLIEEITKQWDKSPVVFIDYLRKLRTDSKVTDERLRVDDIVSKLTDLAKTFHIPILAISELARDSYKSGQRLSMASLKESGTIEYEASWLGILAAVEEKDGEYEIKKNWERIIDHDGNVDLIVFKAKRGTGQTGRLSLKISKDKMEFTDRTATKEQFQSPKRKASKFD